MASCCVSRDGNIELAIILGFIFLLLRIPTYHIELYRSMHVSPLPWLELSEIINQASSFLGSICAFLTSLYILKYANLTVVITLGCFFKILRYVIVFLTSSWPSAIVAGLESCSFGVLHIAVMTFLATKALNDSKLLPQKPSLQVIFALFYGISQMSVVIANIMNYLPVIGFPAQKLNQTFLQFCNTTSPCPQLSEQIEVLHDKFGSSNMSASQFTIDGEEGIRLASYLLFFIICGLLIASYSNKLSVPGRPLSTSRDIRHLFQVITHWKLGFIIPCFIASGFLEGYIYADYIKIKAFCSHYELHIGTGLIAHGIACVMSCMVLVAAARYINRVYAILACSLLHIAIVIILIAWPPRFQHVAVFYVVLSMLGTSMALWHTQLYVAVAVIFQEQPQKRLLAYSTMIMSHQAGYLLACCMSSYLCMRTKLYFLLGSAILAQFMYLVNELQQRIEVISKKTGGGYSDFRSRVGTNSSLSSSIYAFKEARQVLPTHLEERRLTLSTPYDRMVGEDEQKDPPYIENSPDFQMNPSTSSGEIINLTTCV